MPKTILITGASSGIGKHLALEFARRGNDLALAARSLDKLVELQQTIAAEHPQIRIEVRALDVTKYDSVAPVIEDFASTMGGLDIIVANAGIGDGGLVGTGAFAGDRAVIETNVIGAMATIDAAAALFRKQVKADTAGWARGGQIVAISSVGAARGMPGSGSYCASKAAIAVYADSARMDLYNSPIRVTTLFPGFIDTPLNDMMPSRPFLVTAERGAKLIADLIERRVQTSTVPVFPWNLIMRGLRYVPTRMLARQVPF